MHNDEPQAELNEESKPKEDNSPSTPQSASLEESKPAPEESPRTVESSATNDPLSYELTGQNTSVAPPDGDVVGSLLSKSQARVLGAVSLVVCLLLLTPGVISDFLTSRILVPRKLQRESRWQKKQKSRARKEYPLLFRGRGGVILQGHLFQSWKPNKRLVFFVHDFNQDRFEGHELLRTLLAEGFDVFLFDQRAHGQSAGRVGLNPYDQSGDVMEAYAHLFRLFPRRWKKQVGIVGKGLGGAVALIASGRKNAFHAVLAVDPFLDLEKTLRTRLKQYPAFVVDLTLKRISRIGGFGYRYSRAIRHARYMRRSAVRFLNTVPIPKNHLAYSFCKVKRGRCEILYTPFEPPKKKTKSKKSKKRPNINEQLSPWWSSLNLSTRTLAIRFLKKELGLRVPPLPRKATPKKNAPRKVVKRVRAPHPKRRLKPRPPARRLRHKRQKIMLIPSRYQLFKKNRPPLQRQTYPLPNKRAVLIKRFVPTKKTPAPKSRAPRRLPPRRIAPPVLRTPRRAPSKRVAARRAVPVAAPVAARRAVPVVARRRAVPVVRPARRRSAPSTRRVAPTKKTPL